MKKATWESTVKPIVVLSVISVSYTHLDVYKRQALHGGKQGLLADPYYNPNLTHDREDFSESDDLRGLKQGRVEVFPPPASQKREAL